METRAQAVKGKTVEEHYTPDEVGEKLGLSRRAVQDLLKPGAIWPVVRLNARVIRVPASAVNRYLDAHTWNPKAIEAPATS